MIDDKLIESVHDCGWGISGLYNFGYNLKEWFGSSSVARATRVSDGGEVAVRCYCGSEGREREALRREFKILGSLRHDSLIQVEALYESRFEVWLCMEMCTRGNLQERIREEGPVSSHEGVQLAAQLVEGLRYLHGQGIVHRRLEAKTILLQGDGSVLKIADLRHAAYVDSVPDDEPATHGDPQYQAPELKLGKTWTEGVDIWACGLIVYLSLAGHLPFDVNHRDVADALSSGSLPSSIDWTPFSDAIRNMVSGCLSVDPRKRHSAKELLELLELAVP